MNHNNNFIYQNFGHIFLKTPNALTEVLCIFFEDSFNISRAGKNVFMGEYIS